jgi:hypothetical protein
MLTMIKVWAPEDVYTTLMEQNLAIYSRLYSLFGNEKFFKWNGYAFKLDNKAFVIVDIAVIDSKIKYNNKTYVKVV